MRPPQPGICTRSAWRALDSDLASSATPLQYKHLDTIHRLWTLYSVTATQCVALYLAAQRSRLLRALTAHYYLLPCLVLPCPALSIFFTRAADSSLLYSARLDSSYLPLVSPLLFCVYISIVLSSHQHTLELICRTVGSTSIQSRILPLPLIAVIDTVTMSTCMCPALSALQSRFRSLVPC